MIHQTDIDWSIEAKRPGSVPWPGQWYREGSRLVGRITSSCGHEMKHSLPFGLESMQSPLMGGRVDPEGEALRMREVITRQLNADLEARAKRVAAD